MPRAASIPWEEFLPAEGVSADRIDEAQELLRTARRAPERMVLEILKSQDRIAKAQKACAMAERAATEMEGLLEDLLEADALVCHVERVYDDGRGHRVVCNVQGQLRDLRVHPDVDIDDLSDLQPWQFASVHAKEMLVIGLHRDPEFFSRAHGAVVEFKGHYDETRRLARVGRNGHDEEIVRLSSPLQELELKPGTKLILSRDDDSWAIALSTAEEVQSRFEVAIDRITTRFEDLAGIESVAEPFLRDVLLRVIRPDLRELFDLQPLIGLLLASEKPGMGKTALCRALARYLADLGKTHGFDVVLYAVKPNEFKSVWHGEDARRVRELFATIRARQAANPTRPVFQLVLIDEVDSLGSRGGDDRYVSSAQNDAAEALLAEMDGFVQLEAPVLFIGLTNRLHRLDDALRRPGRFGDLVLSMPAITEEMAEGILAVHARGAAIPWNVAGGISQGLDREEICEHFLRPAVRNVFPAVVLRYGTDRQHERSVDVTAGEILAGAHYMSAMNEAKRRAATRAFFGEGTGAIDLDDVRESLLEQALSAAAQLAGDRDALSRQLQLKVPVTRIERVERDAFSGWSFVRATI